MKAQLLRSGLKALYYSGAHRLLASYTQGVGLIFMLHQVNPQRPGQFAPNGILTVRPDFLDGVIRQVRAAGLDIVSLDEARARILQGDAARRFVCFTLDDGYRDNLEHAWPVFRRHGVPITIYVPSDFPQGKGELWWLGLERVIAGNDRVAVTMEASEEVLAAAAVAEKQVAFDRIYWWLRKVDEDRQREFVRKLCARHGVDMESLCRELIMSWDELASLAREPLVTIGAHTVAHYALAKLPAERAACEIEEGAEQIARKLGARPAHFAYPYGDATSAGPREFDLASELGFKTAVTTRKGVVFPEHRDHLTALPRVSLNGAYQSLLYTRLYLTGAPFALRSGFRRLDTD